MKRIHPFPLNFMHRFKSPNYVETGVGTGDSLSLALAAGMTSAIGIDANKRAIEFCQGRFMNPSTKHPDLVLLHADSARWLLRSTSNFQGPVTFFLDASYPHEDPHADVVEDCEEEPLMQELEQLGNHPTREQNTIIASVEYLFGADPAVTNKLIEDVKERLRWVNEKAEIISYITTHGFIISKPPKEKRHGR